MMGDMGFEEMFKFVPIGNPSALHVAVNKTYPGP